MTGSPNAGRPMLRSPSRTGGPPGESAERIVCVNEVGLCVQAFGHAADPVILLIMGSAASMDWWEDGFCERLAAGRRFVIRYDHRDTGRSVSYQPGAPPYTLRDLAADAVGLLDAFGVARAHLVGMSIGGAIAQLVALDHPGRVASLTLIATSPAGPGDPGLPATPQETWARFATIAEPAWSDRAEVTGYLVHLARVSASRSRPFSRSTRRMFTRGPRHSVTARAAAPRAHRPVRVRGR
jgi:pimeloyl-ACP methyl ester carboxylesterase